MISGAAGAAAHQPPAQPARADDDPARSSPGAGPGRAPDPWAPTGDTPTRGTVPGPATPSVRLDDPFTLDDLLAGGPAGPGGTAGGAPGAGPHSNRAAAPESPWAQPPHRPAVDPAAAANPDFASPSVPADAAAPHPHQPSIATPAPPTTAPPASARVPLPGQPQPPAPHGTTAVGNAGIRAGQGYPPGETHPGPARQDHFGPAAAGQENPGPAAQDYPASAQQDYPRPAQQGYPGPGQGQAGQGYPGPGGTMYVAGAAGVPGQPGVPRAAPYPPVGRPQPRGEGYPGVAEVPQQPYGEAAGVTRVPPPAMTYPEPVWTPDSSTPTAEEFARRRASRPADPIATMGVRAAVNKTTLGLVRLSPGRHEQEIRQDIEMVRRNFGGLRQVTVVNPKGGAGKTVAILLLAMTFGQKRGGYVLAWDNNETQGTLGMRAQQDFHSRTVRDMLRDLGQFQVSHGRVGDLSQYVRSQGEGMFDVLASDESATGGEMLTAAAFAEIREVVSRFYKLIFVDTGNNVRAQNWQAAIDATDQLLITMSARNDSAETAARMLDHLEQSGRQRLVRQAVTVVSMPPSRKEIDLPAIQRHFAARTRAVLLAPYERLIDTGEPIRYGQLSAASRDAWLKIAAAVAEGL
ncbi:chromosome partitioning protein [Micromonospora sp. NBC_01796]|uniref:MinD/ParA family ATP-binding protein n=1 Tax=Micromonospora sp. NBC_01796 TaxID=2975987 RepID=UPI003FA3C58A